MVIYLIIFLMVVCLWLLAQSKLSLGLFLLSELTLLGLILTITSIIPFSLFMMLILLACAFIWLFDSLFLKHKRPQEAEDPEVLEYAKSFFPVILVVFLVRSFVAEPFKIPSGSMMPTLLVGDYILVNKYTYGLRVPVLNKVFFEVNQPKQGDVVVFHYPPNPTLDYIKRVVAVPGDRVQYQDKHLIVNGQRLKTTQLADYEYVEPGLNVVQNQQHLEKLGDVEHRILIRDRATDYPMGSLGERLVNGEEITVPEGEYFAMGDNRDNSADSRFWGFVPERNLVGKAFFIWMHFDLNQLSRIGTKIQ